MFSGIVEAQGKVCSARMRRGVRVVEIAAPRAWKLALGESVSVDGICSTVVSRGSGRFVAEYMPETLSKTTASSFAPGRAVNLERSLKYGGRVHGHFVQGHVDARAKVAGVLRKGASRGVSLAMPRALRRLIAAKGSVALNGVSLTVASASDRRFAVALIPHTLSHTNLVALKKGDVVNLEADLAARYLLSRGSGRVGPHAPKKRARR